MFWDVLLGASKIRNPLGEKRFFNVIFLLTANKFVLPLWRMRLCE
jgi:hypothetical protein